MRLTPNDFMRWFSDQLNVSSRRAILGDVVSRAAMFPGEDVDFTIVVQNGAELHFTARLSIKDRDALKRMKIALARRVLTTQPAFWIDGPRREIGAVCYVRGKPVALMAVRDVVHIEVGVEQFDHVIDQTA